MQFERTPKSEQFVEVVRTIRDKFEPGTLVLAYRAAYPQCYEFTRQFEGGYVNDPDDPGGCTNMGITIGTLTAWRDDPSTDCADVMALSETEVGLIYFENYWDPVWGTELPVGLNLQVWDWGVNSGPSRAVKYLQAMVGTAQDGVMGPNTLQAVEDYCDREGVNDAIRTYSARRQAYYESLSTFSKYGKGWTRRNEECRDLGIEISD